MIADLASVLVCPSCHGKLRWEVPETPECSGCGAKYGVQDGVASFRVECTPDDWEHVDSELRRHLDAEPDSRRELLESPAGELGAVDLFFRGLLLEEEGSYPQAERCIHVATERSYRHEYLAALRAEIAWLTARVARQHKVLDVASGRGTLVEAMLADRGPSSVLVASDLSPLVLHRMRRRFAACGPVGHVEYVAFDVAATPFRDSSMDTATTLLGLPNLADPESALRELRRAIGGRLLAVHYFIADDDPNRESATALGSAPMLLREECLAMFARAGWSVEVKNEIVAPASPTPVGRILEGWGIDGFPVVDTDLTWCVLVAS